MSIAISLVFEDGCQRSVDGEFTGFGDAVRYSLELADRLGRTHAADGHGPPRQVRIHQGGFTHLLVTVVSGGLLGSEAIRE